MKRRKYGAVVLCAAAVLLCLAVTALYTAAFIWTDDTRPPVISMADESLELSVNATDAELLAGVTAVDARDGDVTDSLIVQGIDGLADGAVTVTYAAFDASGNVAKDTRTVYFTDYQSPRFGLRKALVFTSGTSIDVLEQIRVTDVLDGNISNQARATLVSNTGSLSYAGVHQVEFRVTNSLGDTSYLTLPVDVLNAGDYNASVELSDYLVYLPQGAEFNARRYVKSLNNMMDDVITDNVYAMNVSVDGKVDTDIPGVYSVRYTVSYTWNMIEYVGYTCLNVVVEG